MIFLTCVIFVVGDINSWYCYIKHGDIVISNTVILLYQTWWYCYITHGDITISHMMILLYHTWWYYWFVWCHQMAWYCLEKMTFETLSKAGRVKTDKRYLGNPFQIFDAADENNFDVALEHIDNEEEDRIARTGACRGKSAARLDDCWNRNKTEEGMMRLKWDCWVTACARVC